jgi:hypothetical protein
VIVRALVLALLAAIVLFVVAVLRRARHSGTPAARCGACRAPHDHDSFVCPRCQADVRESGLDPSDAGAIPNWLRRWLIWTALLPLVVIGTWLVTGDLNANARPPYDELFMRSFPVKARATGPPSDAYEAVHLSSQSVHHDDRLTGFAVVTLERAAGEFAGSLTVLRLGDDGPRRLDTRDGADLTRDSVADWLMRGAPDLPREAALLEADDVLKLIDATEEGEVFLQDPDSGAELARRHHNAFVALQRARDLPPGPERDRRVAEANDRFARAQRAMRTGVGLDHFRTWQCDRGRGSLGWDAHGSPPLAVPFLAIALAIWLAVSAVIVAGPYRTGAGFRRIGLFLVGRGEASR